MVDENKELIKSFGVWGKKKFMGREYDGIHRMTFIINEKGIIVMFLKRLKQRNTQIKYWVLFKAKHFIFLIISGILFR